MPGVATVTTLTSDAPLLECLQAFKSFPFSSRAKEILLAVRQGRQVLNLEEEHQPEIFVKCQGLLILALTVRHGVGRSGFSLSQWQGMAAPFILSCDDGRILTLHPTRWQPSFMTLLQQWGQGGSHRQPVMDKALLASLEDCLERSYHRFLQEEQMMKQIADVPLSLLKGLGKSYPVSALFILLSALPFQELQRLLQDLVMDLPEGFTVPIEGREVNLKRWLDTHTLDPQVLFKQVRMLLSIYQFGEQDFLRTLLRDSFIMGLEDALADRVVCAHVQETLACTLQDQYRVRIPLLDYFAHFLRGGNSHA